MASRDFVQLDGMPALQRRADGYVLLLTNPTTLLELTDTLDALNQQASGQARQQYDRGYLAATQAALIDQWCGHVQACHRRHEVVKEVAA